MKNKEKILHSATRLFNERGFINVRLQHISDDTIISLGNIAYHFKNKEALVTAIFQEWEQKLKEVLIEFRHTPIFANIDRIFTSIQSVQDQYSFFFTDILEIQRSFPELFDQIQQLMQWQVLLFKEILRFNISRGALKAMEETECQFLATLVIHQVYAWPSYSLIWQASSNEQHLSAFMWQFLQPYMTPLGQGEITVLLSQQVPFPEKGPERDS